MKIRDAIADVCKKRNIPEDIQSDIIIELYESYKCMLMDDGISADDARRIAQEEFEHNDFVNIPNMTIAERKQVDSFLIDMVEPIIDSYVK